MSDFYNLLNAIARRQQSRSGSPFAARRRAKKWLQSLPKDSDYDAHHALVEGLERFNAETEPATLERLRALMALEEAGLPLQSRIVGQYLRNQATFKLAQQVLWRESQQFWSHLACAYVVFLKQALMGVNRAEFQGWVASIAVRALRYAGMAMRWEYHQGRAPSNQAWHRLHKIYRLAERKGIVFKAVTMGKDASDCAREFTRIHLLELIKPQGFRPQEIEAVARLFEAHEDLPLPEDRLDPGRHTHAVDMALDQGACVLDGRWVPGRRLRYFALRPLIEFVKTLNADPSDPNSTLPGMAALGQQLASMIERGGVRREATRADCFGRVWAAVGMDNILLALDGTAPRCSELDAWMLRDESAEGIGFTLPAPLSLPHGQLVAVSWDSSEGVWQLLTLRWTREENGQPLIGAERLTRHPKRVRLVEETPEAGLEGCETDALFLPMPDPSLGLSHLLLPQSLYRKNKFLFLHDGESVYRLRLGEVVESHGDWVRAGMDVLGRECQAQAA